MKELGLDFDFVLIDAGSGLGTGAAVLAAAADDVVIVSTPEPTSLADAHASIARFHELQGARIRVLVNQAASRRGSGGAGLTRRLQPAVQRRRRNAPRTGLCAVRSACGQRRFAAAGRSLRRFRVPLRRAGVRRIARSLVQERHPPVVAEWAGFRAAIKARLRF